MKCRKLKHTYTYPHPKAVLKVNWKFCAISSKTFTIFRFFLPILNSSPYWKVAGTRHLNPHYVVWQWMSKASSNYMFVHCLQNTNSQQFIYCKSYTGVVLQFTLMLYTIYKLDKNFHKVSRCVFFSELVPMAVVPRQTFFFLEQNEITSEQSVGFVEWQVHHHLWLFVPVCNLSWTYS